MYKDSLFSPQNYDEFSQNTIAKAQYDAVNAELHDVEIGTRLEKKNRNGNRTRKSSERCSSGS